MKKYAYVFAALLIGIGAYVNDKPYAVLHTTPEWQAQVQGLMEVQRIIHKSDLPANEAFYCDSILQGQRQDIFNQVSAAIQRDTVKVKK